jgi:hypothetical protein
MSATPGPYAVDTFLPDKTTVIGKDGFPVGFANQIAILPRYDERLKVNEWQSHHGKAFVTRPVAEAEANARLFAASFDYHAAVEFIAKDETRDAYGADSEYVPVSRSVVEALLAAHAKAGSR